MAKKRNYRLEESRLSPTKRKRRRDRRNECNKQRRKHGLKVGDGKQVHHSGGYKKKGQSTKVISAKKNMRMQPKRSKK